MQYHLSVCCSQPLAWWDSKTGLCFGCIKYVKGREATEEEVVKWRGGRLDLFTGNI